MSFESKQGWKDYQDKMDEAMWGVFCKDAPEGGYWELVYFTKFASRFLMMKAEDILCVLDKPYKWDNEYRIYKKFQKLVDGFKVYNEYMGYNKFISLMYLLRLSINFLIKR